MEESKAALQILLLGCLKQVGKATLPDGAKKLVMPRHQPCLLAVYRSYPGRTSASSAILRLRYPATQILSLLVHLPIETLHLSSLGGFS